MEHVKNSSNLDRSRDCWNFLHAARNYAGYFFLQNMETSGNVHGIILLGYNAASTIRIKTENISTS